MSTLTEDGLLALRTERLAAQTRLLAAASPFYRGRLAPEGVSTFDELAGIPLTHKQDFLDAPDDFRLELGDTVAVEESALAYMIYTTGTTSGRPAPLYITTADDWAYQLHAKRCAEILGMGGDEVIANLFPLTPFPMGARIRADRTAAALGIPILQGHTGRRYDEWPVHRRLDEAIALVAEQRATVLWGVSGFVRRLVLRAAELGIELPSVRWCFITGEATSDARMADLKACLAAVGAPDARIVNRYGSTEGWSMVACDDEHGWHNPTPEEMYFEVVDDDGRPVPDGEPGRLAVTHLRTRGSALLRYVIGDVVTISRERCPGCGRIGERITTPPVRSGALVKINGTLVNGSAISESLVAVPGLREWRVAFEYTTPGDELSGDAIVVEIAPIDLGDAALDATRAAVSDLVVSLAHVTPRIRVLSADQIYDPAIDAKPRRFVDRRVLQKISFQNTALQNTSFQNGAAS